MKADETQLADAIASLLRRISNAFADVPRPSITHSVARGYDDEWALSPERGRELAALDTEQTWSEVTDGAIEKFHEYFTFADAEGWRFYLPAHMSYYLRHFQHCGYDAVYWACTSPDRRLGLLSTEQCACVDEFLTLIHEYEVGRQ
jgi:hypothetical protein